MFHSIAPGWPEGRFVDRASHASKAMTAGFQAGGVKGGQLMTTSEVENFPGFPQGITGPDLMDRMQAQVQPYSCCFSMYCCTSVCPDAVVAAQAERWGAELLNEDVESVDLSQRPFVIRGSDTTLKAHSLIVATGATAKRCKLHYEYTMPPC